MNDLVGFSSFSSTPVNPISATPSSSQMTQPTQVLRPVGYQAAQPNYFTSVPALSNTQSTPTPLGNLSSRPSAPSANSFKTATSKPASGNDAFGNLWSAASASAGIKKPTAGSQGPKLAEMAKEKASQGIWGSTNTATTSQALQQQRPLQPQGQPYGGGLDDLLG